MPWRRNERTEREYQTDFRIRKELEWISREKTDKKSVVWTVNMRCFNLTNKFWQLKSPPIPFFAKFEVN